MIIAHGIAGAERHRQLVNGLRFDGLHRPQRQHRDDRLQVVLRAAAPAIALDTGHDIASNAGPADDIGDTRLRVRLPARSEEHTSELQSLMRISYAVFCLKKKKNTNKQNT